MKVLLRQRVKRYVLSLMDRLSAFLVQAAVPRFTCRPTGRYAALKAPMVLDRSADDFLPEDDFSEDTLPLFKDAA